MDEGARARGRERSARGPSARTKPSRGQLPRPPHARENPRPPSAPFPDAGRPPARRPSAPGAGRLAPVRRDLLPLAGACGRAPASSRCRAPRGLPPGSLPLAVREVERRAAAGHLHAASGALPWRSSWPRAFGPLTPWPAGSCAACALLGAPSTRRSPRVTCRRSGCGSRALAAAATRAAERLASALGVEARRVAADRARPLMTPNGRRLAALARLREPAALRAFHGAPLPCARAARRRSA